MAKAKQQTTLGLADLGLDAGVNEKELYKCVHCGLCLSSCPTYLELGLETESPRGRLALMKAVNEGRAEYTDRLVGHMELCLLCRACEAACPSQVPFGSLMADTRANIQNRTDGPRLGSQIQDLAFKHLLPHKRRLELAFRLARIYQDSGLQRWVRKSGLLSMVPSKLAEMESAMPPLPERFFPPSNMDFFPAMGNARAVVGFFSGCIMPLTFGHVNAATMRVLSRNGCDVVIPSAQGCCAALNHHGGEKEAAGEMAKRNIDAFEAAGVDAVIVNSAGCGAMLKEYNELLEGEPDYAQRAKSFVGKVKDINEFLSELSIDANMGHIDKRATYQDSCHLAHAQRIKDQPRELMGMIPGLELIEMPGSDRCCGAAGVYQITQREMSYRLLQSKMDDVTSTGADLVVTANPGCMIQLDSGLRERGVPGRSFHVIELLDWAYALADTNSSE